MYRILLIEDEPQMVDKLTFILEGLSGSTILFAPNFRRAQEIIETDDKISLIVADYRCGETPEVEKFKGKAIFTDSLVCVDDITAPNQATGWRCLEKIERANVASSLKAALEKLQKNLAYSEKDRFCRIKTTLLLETSPLHADIYAKLSDKKYLKIFLAGDIFDANDFKKYTEQRKIEYMYLREDGCQKFISKYIAQIDELAKKRDSMTLEQLTQLNITAYESVQELTSALGFTKEVQDLAKAHVQMTVHFMDKKPTLSKLLSKLKAQKGKYLADHSYMISYIACGISTHMEWGSESTFFKLSLAAFLHDISLTDPDIAACSNVNDVISLGLDNETVVNFKNHPKVAADYARRMSEIPPDVDVIIQQHHELPNGKGFPQSLSANYIAPLSTIFIVAHDMVKEIFLKTPDVFTLQDYLVHAQEKFQHSSFRKVLGAIKKMELNL